MRARVRGCIAERHLHIRLSRWETGQKKGQWPGMRAISEPLGGGGGDNPSKSKHCSGVRVLPGKGKEVMWIWT